ncbi:MAG: ArsA-related P-loop ATPase [Aquificota bacterium]|nr:ArsA-related P-loop ATPase [Aquificota bacterium]
MRVILFSGKGGVGKTTLSAASGYRPSELGYRTIVVAPWIPPTPWLMPLTFPGGGEIFSKRVSPSKIRENLYIQVE